MKREDAAWLAGFYEGEGSIYATNRHKPGYGAQMTFTQREPEMLERVRELLSNAGVQVAGKTDWYEDNRNQAHGGHHRLRVGKFESVQAAIAFMWPWLSERRKVQAAVALTCRPQKGGE